MHKSIFVAAAGVVALSVMSVLVGRPGNSADRISTKSLDPASISNSAALVYQIGDVGPGGGNVFITPNSEGNLTGKYFEAAPYADETKVAWCDDIKTVTGASNEDIGAGQGNTVSADVVCVSGAVQAASDYVNNGFDDWCLPSKDELNAMFVNRDSLGGFTNASYWSSSEALAPFVWRQNFYGGNIGQARKSDTKAVRPVRTFG